MSGVGYMKERDSKTVPWFSTRETGRSYLVITRSLYVATYVHEMELRRALIDSGFSLNIMSFSTV